MPRYIDADLIVERCQRQEKDEWNKKAAPISWADAYEQFETDISCIPTEDVVPVVHAHWVSEEAKRVGWSVGWDNETFGCPESTCYCSHCGEWLTASDEYHVTGKYCPNCGANMGFVNGQTRGKRMDIREYEHLQECLSDWQRNPPCEIGSSGNSYAEWGAVVLQLKSMLHEEYEKMGEQEKK